MGSGLVISNNQETSDPAAEPRPGPCKIPCFFIQRQRSAMARKTPEKGEFAITSSSVAESLAVFLRDVISESDTDFFLASAS